MPNPVSSTQSRNQSMSLSPCRISLGLPADGAGSSRAPCCPGRPGCAASGPLLSGVPLTQSRALYLADHGDPYWRRKRKSRKVASVSSKAGLP
jgi:hypothetical protein